MESQLDFWRDLRRLSNLFAALGNTPDERSSRLRASLNEMPVELQEQSLHELAVLAARLSDLYVTVRRADLGLSVFAPGGDE